MLGFRSPLWIGKARPDSGQVKFCQAFADYARWSRRHGSVVGKQWIAGKITGKY